MPRMDGMEVLRRLVAGQRLTDIAESLHLSVKTVSTHKSRIQEKLQLPNMAALICYGMENGMETPQVWSDSNLPEDDELQASLGF